jgi:predicted dehydrogenase
MTDKQLRVGIVGIGAFAYGWHVPNLRQTERAEVIAISRRNPQALQDAKEALGVAHAFADWREMLDRVPLDAVVVSTAHTAHTEPAVAALERGLHVLVEKPMALTGDDAWAMVRAAERSGRVLMTCYGPRFQGLWRSARKALQAGAIGTVWQISVTQTYDNRWLWTGGSPRGIEEIARKRGIPGTLVDEWLQLGFWRRHPSEMGGGEFIDRGAHTVDLALWLAGSAPVEVAALAESAGMPVEMHLTFQARLAGGTLLSFVSADGVPIETGQRRIAIFGDDGALIAEDDSVSLVRGKERTQLEVTEPSVTPDAAFVAAILDGTPNPAPGIDGAYTVALTEAVYRSASSGQMTRIKAPESTSSSVP